MGDYKVLAGLLGDDFREVLADRTLKGEDRITALIECVGRLHENLASVDMRNCHVPVEQIEYNGGDLVLNIDANGHVESVAFGYGADLSFYA